MKKEELKTACPVCKNEIENKICSECGVRKPKHKTTLRSLILDTLSNILSLERSGLGTCIAITARPTEVVNSYMDGYRNHYQTPGRILFYTISFSAIYISVLDSSLGLSGTKTTINMISKHTFILLSMFVFFSISSFFTYIRTRLSYIYHLVSAIYIISTNFMLYYLLIGLSYLFILNESDYGSLAFGVIITHYVIANATVFTRIKKWWRILINIFLHLVIFYIFINLLNILNYFVTTQNPDSTLFSLTGYETNILHFIHHLTH